MLRLLLALAAASSLPATASAQRLIAQDTLSMDTPTALSCGFCAGEAYGVVFRELPAPGRGLEEGDFPIILHGLRIAVADARVTSGSCRGSAAGGTALADVEAYTGPTPPAGSIVDNPEEGPWAGETLVWAGIDVPLTLSAADADGSERYELQFNELLVLDDVEQPVRIEAPNRYVRIVVRLKPGPPEMSDGCTPLGLMPPSLFPMRDNDDSVIAPERDFILAAGVGWLWSEDARVGIDGDWAVRILVFDDGTGPDGGVPGDAGPADAGPRDAGGRDGGDDGGADAGGGGVGGGGCGCRTSGGDGGSLGIALVLGAVLLHNLRKRRVG